MINNCELNELNQGLSDDQLVQFSESGCRGKSGIPSCFYNWCLENIYKSQTSGSLTSAESSFNLDLNDLLRQASPPIIIPCNALIYACLSVLMKFRNSHSVQI